MLNIINAGPVCRNEKRSSRLGIQVSLAIYVFLLLWSVCGRLVRQYRACVVDSLGLGITCVLCHCTVCTRHPDLVSFAIPIFRIII